MLSVCLRKRKKKNIGQKRARIAFDDMYTYYCKCKTLSIFIFFGQIAKGEFKPPKSPHLARIKVQKPNHQQKKGYHFREKHPEYWGDMERKLVLLEPQRQS